MPDKDSLFDLLSAIDRGDKSSYEKYEDQYNPYITMKWLASCKDPIRISRVNGLLNVVSFSLNKDKKLLYYLSCALSDGEKKRYNWIKRYKNNENTKVEILSAFFNITPREARTSLHLYTIEDWIEMAIELGYTEKEIKALHKKIKNDT